MVLVEAKVLDSTHLELSKPISATQGGTVIVAVAEASEYKGERNQWLAAGTGSLQDAYGEFEPDYSEAMVKESNPDYAP